MDIPTTEDYRPLYEELVAHCDFFSGERQDLRIEVVNLINDFMAQFGEFINNCGDVHTVTYGQWLQLLASNKSPYHSDDIRRMAEYIWVACEDGIEFRHYMERQDRYRARIRASLNDPFGY